MPAEQQKIVASASYLKFRQMHGRLSRVLISVLISLVLLFDFLCVYAKGFMGAPAVNGSVISNGIVLALAIILLVLGASLYYIRRINSAYVDMHNSADED